MKKIFLLGAFLLAGNCLQAQDTKMVQNHSLLWGTAGLGGSYGASVSPAASAALTAVHPNGWGLSAAIRYTRRNARNTPADYKKYTGGFNWGGPDQPQDGFTTYSLSAVRRRHLGTGRQISFLLEAGPALVRIGEQHFRLVPDVDQYASNYETVQTPRFVPGLHAAAGIAGAPFRGFGIGLQAWTNLNPVTPLIGLDFQLLFGRVR